MQPGWRRYLERLPNALQRTLVDVAMATGAGRSYLHLALRSLEAFGCDRFVLEDLCRGVRSIDGIGPAAAAKAARLAALGERAVAEGHRATGAELLQQATLLFAVADRLALPAEKVANFERLSVTADRMRALDVIATRRVAIDGCPAYYRVPCADNGNGGVVVIVQGTNTSKDMFFALEQQLLARGLGILTIDQPGTGECLLRGRRIRTLADLQPVAQAIFAFLESQQEDTSHRVGVFGFSLGGMVAPALCALDKRFGACAMVATGLRLDAKTLDHEPPQLKERAMFVAGVETWVEARALALSGLDLTELAPGVRCPVRAYHGANDAILPVSGARELFMKLESPDRHLTVIAGGDHTCSRALRTEVLPGLFDWLADALSPITRTRPDLPRDEHAA